VTDCHLGEEEGFSSASTLSCQASMVFVASGLQLLRRGAVVQRVAGNPGELVGRES